MRIDTGILTLVANPSSGRGKARRILPLVLRELSSSGVEANLVWTKGPGDAVTLARDAVANGSKLVVACGGDGTVHEVVNGLMTIENPPLSAQLGVIPLGRCNDMARTFNLPADPLRIAEYLLNGRSRSIDLGLVGGKYFTTVATLGFDSAVNQYVAQGSSIFFKLGTVAYLYGILVNLFRYRDVWVRLKGDFGEFEGKIFLAATGNTPTYAGRMKITPDAVVDDGWMNLCMVKSTSRLEILRMLPTVFTGSHVNHPSVFSAWVKHLEIESSTPLWICADGETIVQTPASIEIVPQALSILVPFS